MEITKSKPSQFEWKLSKLFDIAHTEAIEMIISWQRKQFVARLEDTKFLNDQTG